MARIKLKQVLSNMAYDATKNQLHISGSSDFTVVLSGSLFVTSSTTITGSVTIAGIDTFGDSGSFYTVDLGDNDF
jgi:muramoyltetrapeptide carboxypeptidase LdcA involved in peptidoglycan recycling